MKKQMRLSFFLVSFLCIYTTQAPSISLSKPNCPEKCGNVTIPYPFGIGLECSANSSFTIICQNSTHPPTPILANFNVEIIQIFMEGVVIINLPVSPLNCSHVVTQNTLPISFSGTPYTISSFYNIMLNIGCENSVWLYDYNGSDVDGCIALCHENSTNIRKNSDSYCQIDITDRLNEFKYAYVNNRVSKGGFCGYVFLVEKRWWYNRTSNLLLDIDIDIQVAPLLLEWEYDTHTGSKSIYCNNYFGDDEHDYKSTTRYCNCGLWYEGNPYLPGGCTDIDECTNAALLARYGCEPGTCVNTNGSFICNYTWDEEVPNAALSLDKRDSDAILSRLKIVVIAIGIMIGILNLFYGVWWSGNAIGKVMKAMKRYKNYNRNGGLLLEQQLASTDNGLEKTMLFGSRELAHATDHYNKNRILGRGGQGTVYKGMLADGKIVAVKKSKKLDTHDLQVFINEVVILSQINHRNVVKMLGCCLETEVPLLVYEFIPNDTLFQHIHEPNEELPLTWEMRVRIATEIAGAISYLHCSTSAPIFHRDIKSTNILLDEKYQAKVADFGTSRSIAIDQTHLTTRVIGTFGYLDPEYFQSSHFTEKSDVYSFGVVIVELLTGEKAVTSIRAESGRSLATHFLHTMEEDHLFDIVDARVLEEGRREEIMAIAELARKCLHMNGRRRPTMKEVAIDLEGIQRGMKQRMLSLRNLDDNIDNSLVEASNDESSCEFSSISGSIHMDTTTGCSQEIEIPIDVD